MNPRKLTVTLLILFAVLSRFLPHPPNFTPVLAIGLFGGATFSKRSLAFIIPLAAMAFSDLFLGLHSTLMWVYGAMLLSVGIGILIHRRKSALTILSGTIGSAILFFVITNFGVWITGGGYGHPLTISGLTACYVDAIPFFRNTLVSNLVYTGVLFGAFESLARIFPVIRIDTAPAN